MGIDEGQRRSEILQAEEAIRLLAGELAKTKSATAAADEVRVRLEQAVGIVAQAGNSVTEAMRVQAGLVEAAKGTVKAAGEEAREAMSIATERLQAGMKEAHDTYEQFQATTVGIAGRTEQMAQLLEGRLGRISSSLAALEKGLTEVQSLIKPLEGKLSELSSSVDVTAAMVAEARQEAKRYPGELAAKLRHSLGKRSAILVYGLVLLAMSLVGVCATIWLLLSRGAGFP
jgi:predicted  nucleic acid-binding Zn-ribbon protein